MKRLFYILTSLRVLSSCTDELSVSNEYLDVREGDDVNVTVAGNMNITATGNVSIKGAKIYLNE